MTDDRDEAMFKAFRPKLSQLARQTDGSSLEDAEKPPPSNDELAIAEAYQAAMQGKQAKKRGRPTKLPVPPPRVIEPRIIEPEIIAPKQVVTEVEVMPAGQMTRKEWSTRLAVGWQRLIGGTVEGTFRLGNDLIAAKKALKHGEFTSMVLNDLPFTGRTARRFMAIARDPRLAKWTHESVLPTHWGTLYLLTRLDDPAFEQLREGGVLRPDMERGEVSKVLRLERVRKDEQRVLGLAPVRGKFRTIVVDPAWEYDWLSVGARARVGYAMQTLEQLRALDVKAWADEAVGAHLYCWTTNNFMAEACSLVAQWGFQHRTILTWVKPPPFGLGQYYRNSTEHVIFATLGDTTTRPAASAMPTHFEAPRGEHSEKPERFYEIVREASYPPYGEANQVKARADFANLFEVVGSQVA